MLFWRKFGVNGIGGTPLIFSNFSIVSEDVFCSFFKNRSIICSVNIPSSISDWIFKSVNLLPIKSLNIVCSILLNFISLCGVFNLEGGVFDLAGGVFDLAGEVLNLTDDIFDLAGDFLIFGISNVSLTVRVE